MERYFKLGNAGCTYCAYNTYRGGVLVIILLYRVYVEFTYADACLAVILCDFFVKMTRNNSFLKIRLLFTQNILTNIRLLYFLNGKNQLISEVMFKIHQTFLGARVGLLCGFALNCTCAVSNGAVRLILPSLILPFQYFIEHSPGLFDVLKSTSTRTTSAAPASLLSQWLHFLSR